MVPTPVKPMIQPERLTGRAGSPAGPGGDGVPRPLRNPSFSRLVRDLSASGVAVFDPGPVLARAADVAGAAGSRDVYLRTDTHWTPAAMDRVARALAAAVTERLGPPERPVDYDRQPVRISGTGDIARMLRLPPAAGRFPPQEVTTRRVTTPAGGLWRPERDAEVLLLGDSFTNVYSQDALGWGGGAGLAEQLAVHLRRPVDRIAVNAGGAHTTREALARELGDDPGRLDGVRLVIYQFADRELSHGDWRPVDLAGGGSRARTAAAAPPAEAPVPGPAGAPAGAAPDRPADRAAADWSGGLGRGFAVWESNRSGDWRLWTADLDGRTARRLTADEPGMQHCCAHLSPDGTRLVYLASPAPKDRYPETEVVGELRLIELGGSPDPDPGRERREQPTLGTTIAPAAKSYGWGNRSAVWRTDDELIHVGGDGRTYLLELSSDGSGAIGVTARRGLTTEPRDELGWLIDATLGHATAAAPTFSVYDAGGRRVLDRSDLGGCEPYFTHDGRWGFWVPGAGGPVDRIDLETRRVSTILHKSDPRLGERGYVYFPMVSRDGRLLAFGASTGEHSHFEADYDIFVMPTDPATLAVLGPPVRITADPSTDRYPDVHLARPSPAYRAAEAALDAAQARSAEPEASARGAEEGTGWPPARDGARDRLVFLWQTGDSPNLVAADSAGTAQGGPDGARRAFTLEPRGRARLDHDFRMVLDRGAFVAPAEAAQAWLDAAVATNELTVEATLTPADPATDGDEMGRIVTFSSNRTHRNFTLGQVGDRLVARVRTGPTGANADRPQVELFEVEPGVPVHVAVTYTPGRLVAYRDGEPVVETGAVRGSISPQWRFRQLLFGGEWGDRPAGRPPDGGDWRGTLEGVAIYSRALSPAAIRASAERYRQIAAARPEVSHWRVRVRREATSEIPTLRQISPYRRALAVATYRVLGGPDAPSPGAPSGTIRVARWAILDGATQPDAAGGRGAEEVLTLERYADNPQLEGVYLSDTVAPPAAGEGGGPLYYAVAPR